MSHIQLIFFSSQPFEDDFLYNPFLSILPSTFFLPHNFLTGDLVFYVILILTKPLILNLSFYLRTLVSHPYVKISISRPSYRILKHLIHRLLPVAHYLIPPAIILPRQFLAAFRYITQALELRNMLPTHANPPHTFTNHPNAITLLLSSHLKLPSDSLHTTRSPAYNRQSGLHFLPSLILPIDIFSFIGHVENPRKRTTPVLYNHQF